jgi:hypothetical protein
LRAVFSAHTGAIRYTSSSELNCLTQLLNHRRSIDVRPLLASGGGVIGGGSFTGCYARATKERHPLAAMTSQSFRFVEHETRTRSSSSVYADLAAEQLCCLPHVDFRGP